MVLGGSSNGTVLSEVELFNWKTGKMFQLANPFNGRKHIKFTENYFKQ